MRNGYRVWARPRSLRIQRYMVGKVNPVIPTARRAVGITGFTLPTMYRWIRSDLGRAHTLHPFAKGHYLGSGAGEKVIAEAGLDGEGQYRAIRAFLHALAGGI